MDQALVSKLGSWEFESPRGRSAVILGYAGGLPEVSS